MSNVLYSPGHVKVARPILKIAVIVMGILSGISIGGGIVAIIWNALSPTTFDILGVTLSTGHVGVAFSALGLVTMLLVIRSVLNYTHKLAALPNNSYEGIVEIPDRNVDPITQSYAKDQIVGEIRMLVQEAIQEAEKKDFSRIPFQPREKTIEGGLILREFFGEYLGRLNKLLQEIDRSNIEDAAKLIDDFLMQSWMNHLLDSSVDTYVLKDYLTELHSLILAKGGALKRITPERINYLSRDWENLSQRYPDSNLDQSSLELVISSLSKNL